MPHGTLRPVRTLVISDLHVGAAKRTDLLRRPELREPLLEAVRGVDRLVILGDGIELRDGPQRDAVALAGPLFEELGRALGPDGELLLLAGNHDHGLVAGWIDGRLLVEPAGLPLARAADRAARRRPARRRRWPSARRRPASRSPIPASGCATTCTRSTATTPTCTRRCRRSSASPRARWRAGSSGCPATAPAPDDYEAALAPLYAWMHALTQRSGADAGERRDRRLGPRLGGDGRPRAPHAPGPHRGAERRLPRGGRGASTRRALARSSADLSGAGLRRGYLHGIARGAAPARAWTRRT